MGDEPAGGGWRDVANALPGFSTLQSITTAEPAQLRPADLVDAIRGCERLLSHVAGLQASLITEFARPGRAGDISRMVQTFTDPGGAASTPSGQVDTDVLEVLVLDHAHGLAAAELGAALDIAPVTARHRLEAAVDLHDELPATHLALTEGRIDRGRAALIADRTSVLEPELRLRVEAIVLPLVAGRTAGRLRPLIDRAVLIADPDAANKRIEKAHREREVTHQPIKDQMSVIRAVLPADGAVSVFTLIDLLADAGKSASDDRDVAQRRADALTDLATEMLNHGRVDLRGLLQPAGGTDGSPDPDGDGEVDSESDWYDEEESAEGSDAPDAGGTGYVVPATPDSPSTETSAGPDAIPTSQAGIPARLPTKPDAGATAPTPHTGPGSTAAPPSSDRLLRRQGRRPHLTVTMSLSTLMALDQSPGHLEGYGAISAQLAAAIAASAASLSLAVVDPVTGSPLYASGRRKYRPGQQQRDVISVLAETCRFPSCRQPAWRCDLDHREPFDHRSPDSGGATDLANLDPYCRRHHLMKHRTDWTPRRDPDGTIAWKSPTGHRYTDRPRELTLPGELPAPLVRHTAVGLAEHEHREQCGEPITREEPTPVAVRVRLAMRRSFHQQVRDRIRAAQQSGRLGGTGAPVPQLMPDSGSVLVARELSDENREWIDTVISRPLSSPFDRPEHEVSRPAVEPPADHSPQGDDDTPPF